MAPISVQLIMVLGQFEAMCDDRDELLHACWA